MGLSKPAKVRLIAVVGALLMVGPVVVLVLGGTVLSDQIDGGVPPALQASGSDSGTATPVSTETYSGPTCGGEPAPDASCVEIENNLDSAVAVDVLDRTVRVGPGNSTEIAVSQRIVSAEIEVRDLDTGETLDMSSYGDSSEGLPRHHHLLVDTANGNQWVQHRTSPINASE